MIPRPILSRVAADEFIGRDAELRAIVQRAGTDTARGLVIQAVPGSGAGELLRQAYDRLFMRRGQPVPLHFAFNHNEQSASSAARRFFQIFLQQYIAYRRVDPSLCDAPLTLNDLLDLALPSDFELINNVLEGLGREQSNERDFVSFCFSLPHRLKAEGRTIYPLIDCMSLRPFREDLSVGEALVKALTQTEGNFTLLGLRRQVASLAHTGAGRAPADLIHLERLPDDDARRLVDTFARHYGVETNSPTRDLIVQQLNGSPFFITEFVAAAAESKTQLTGFLECQKLYVDELLGGRLKRHFDRMLEMVTPSWQTRRTLMRVLYESADGETRKASLWAWKKRLGVPPAEFERIIDALHACELVNSSAAFIEVNHEADVWMDYLRAHYRAEVATESRARIVATTLVETLKRAPQTMARKYRRESALGLRELLAQFNCQSVPATLFHYDRFAASYKGADIVAIDAGLDAESELIRLPQIIYVAPAAAYSAEIAAEPDRCVVAHGFEAAEYTDDNETVWLAAEIDSKLEASRELTEEWCNRLNALARECEFAQVRIWLVAPEGFSEPASELLKERGAFGSSRQQAELLTARIKAEPGAGVAERGDEYEMVIPMGEDTELIAAHTAEQIARRANFRPEAINQIKTALVEACINAAEHSLSPDRKIYQRFVVEDDKLVVTVASRGVVPAQLGQNGQETDASGQAENGKSRRGWGLKLIRTLMDEVVFERVDDGTQLRMTKYIR